MNNEVYLAKNLANTLESLPKNEADQVIRTLDLLGEDVMQHSKAISTGGNLEEGLRVARTGPLRVLFHYVPQSRSVIVTDISSKLYQETDAELLAAASASA